MLTSSRTTNILLIGMITVGIAIVAMLATGVRGGPLDPPGPVASTQSNIIFQPASCANFPIVLSAPGSYRLGSNITGCAAKDGIQITTSNVTLDLGGFSVIGVPGSRAGIKNVGANGQQSILNGRVQQWGDNGIDLTGSTTAQIDHLVATNNAHDGVVIDQMSAIMNTTASNNLNVGIRALGINNRITSCQADSNTIYGIRLVGAGNVVEDCAVGNNGAYGIVAANISRIVRNHVHNNAETGIIAGDTSTVEDNSVAWNGGHGIICGPNRCSVRGNSATANGAGGIIVSGGMGVIEGNHALANLSYGIEVGDTSPGYPNVVLRNVAASNLPGNYLIWANNDAGPQGQAGSATLPGTNYSN